MAKGDKCRAYIIKTGLRPDVFYWHGRKVWDGFTGTRDNGERTLLGGGLAPMMRKMLKEGYWPDLHDVVKDWVAYWRARDSVPSERTLMRRAAQRKVQ